jgi:hypothetical protein
MAGQLNLALVTAPPEQIAIRKINAAFCSFLVLLHRFGSSWCAAPSFGQQTPPPTLSDS